MERHLKAKYASEPAVAELLLRSNSTDKKAGFSRLRKMEAFKRNMELVSTRQGKVVVNRRGDTMDPTLYAPCPGCLGLSLKRNLQKHQDKGPGAGQDNSQPGCVDHF